MEETFRRQFKRRPITEVGRVVFGDGIAENESGGSIYFIDRLAKQETTVVHPYVHLVNVTTTQLSQDEFSEK